MNASATSTLIAIKEARKLLGQAAKGISDNEIATMVSDMEVIARNIIKEIGVRNTELVQYKHES